MTLYGKGKADMPSRFWTIVTSSDIEGTHHRRPEIILTESEQIRYNLLVLDGWSEPCFGDVLDRFFKNKE